LEYGTFSHHPNLTDLDIAYNSLKRIDLNIFVTLTSLQNLALDGNDLTEIAYEDIKHTLPNLKSVSLSDNNWNCTYLTAMIRKMTSDGVEIKIDPAKIVRNSTNQKGIACRDTNTAHQEPVLRFDATTVSTQIQEAIDKLIASINTTSSSSTQHQDQLENLEKKLANLTQLNQNQLILGSIHTLIDQLNNLTLQRQQFQGDMLSQKIYELNFNLDRTVKDVKRLEDMIKAKDNISDVNIAKYNQGSPDPGSMVVINGVAILITIIISLYCGFKVSVYCLGRQKRRVSSFSKRFSTVTLEQSI
jgi:Leucine rich repeat